MTKESIYALQRIDCNCNNCFFMKRDFETYSYWENWHREIDLSDFERKKAKAIKDADAIELMEQREAMLKKAHKLVFQFKKPDINYGHCEKFKKPVSFIPDTCQIETQKCFIHRADVK